MLYVFSKKRHLLLCQWNNYSELWQELVGWIRTKILFFLAETLLQVKMFLPDVKLNLIETTTERHNGACQTDPLFHIVKYRGRHITPSQPIVSNNDCSELAESYYQSLQILLIAILSALQLLSSEPISEDGKYKLICKRTMAQSIKTAGSFPRSFSSLTDATLPYHLTCQKMYLYVPIHAKCSMPKNTRKAFLP